MELEVYVLVDANGQLATVNDREHIRGFRTPGYAELGKSRFWRQEQVEGLQVRKFKLVEVDQ